MSEIVRSFAAPVEASTVTRGDQHTRKIRGVASVVYDGTPGTEYAIGDNVVERIAPGAFDHLLADDVICCVDHDGKLIVGRNGSNLKLWTSPRGLEYEVDLPNTTAGNDLWENVQRGILKGSSFKASVKLSDKSCVEWSRSAGQDVLTIKRFLALKDVSPVSDPAYKGTDVGALQRSREAFHQDQETAKRIERMKNIRQA